MGRVNGSESYLSLVQDKPLSIELRSSSLQRTRSSIAVTRESCGPVLHPDSE